MIKCFEFLVACALIALTAPTLSFAMFSGGNESWTPNESGLYREVSLPTKEATYVFKFKGKQVLQLVVRENEIITRSNGIEQITWTGGSSTYMGRGLVYEMTSQDSGISVKFELYGKTTDIDEIQEI